MQGHWSSSQRSWEGSKIISTNGLTAAD
jgi:hypothetical protein